jgi:KaiC/GvpD/RAD55 family RecA-like ATPase
MFNVKQSSVWAAEGGFEPPCKQLFNELWHEGELCFLYGDTNTGKSILAVQIANAIASGCPLWTDEEHAAPAQQVIYFDFELSKRQFYIRYSDERGVFYDFSRNMLRAELDLSRSNHNIKAISFEDAVMEDLRQVVQQSMARVLVIDNLTYLSAQMEQAKDASGLMKQLKQLKEELDLSILVIAHTPKRDQSRPIEKNDLQGSKMLINFSDSACAIGQSNNDKNIRYVKQMKERNNEKKFGTENVIVCEVNKKAGFLHFDMIGYGHERNHLKEVTDKDDANMLDNIVKLHKEGLSMRDIAAQLGISRSKVHRTVNK